jgi:hypothetical protein
MDGSTGACRPGIVPLELLLVSIAQHAVWVAQADVYPAGVC